LRSLRDELHADKGEVDFPKQWRIAYVAQETPALERPALDYANRRRHDLAAPETSLQKPSTRTTAPDRELHRRARRRGRYTVRSRAEFQLLPAAGVLARAGRWSPWRASRRLAHASHLAQALMCPLLQARFSGAQGRVAVDGVVERRALERRRLLRHVGDAPLASGNPPRPCRRAARAQERKQARLARAVRADQADAVAGVERTSALSRSVLVPRRA